MTAEAQGSVSFDQVADRYDATRKMPREVARAQRDAILAELRAIGADRALEVGIGTGLVSRPLMKKGVEVTGIDISSKMLGRLRGQLTAEHTRPDLLLGDATRLPFANDAFPAIVMSHVFHVVSGVDATLDEIKRVLSPGGVFLHDRTRYSESNPWHETYVVREQMMASYGIVVRHRPTPSEIEAKLTARCASLRGVRYYESRVPNLVDSMIAQARSRMFSWGWSVPDDVYQRFLTEYDAWCRQHFTADEYLISHEMEVWTFL
jgi:ubiquinone/menaquinone biosynthesis C-methylase UbiE